MIDLGNIISLIANDYDSNIEKRISEQKKIKDVIIYKSNERVKKKLTVYFVDISLQVGVI